MSDAIQLGLRLDPESEPTRFQDFRAWKQLPGSKQVLREVYRQTAPFGRRFVESGGRRGVSMKLVWEIVRDRLDEVRYRCKRKGLKLSKWEGFSANNVMTPYIARHIEDHRPEWKGMFERRTVGRSRKLIEEKQIDITTRRYA